MPNVKLRPVDKEAVIDQIRTLVDIRGETPISITIEPVLLPNGLLRSMIVGASDQETRKFLGALRIVHDGEQLRVERI